MFHSPCNQVIFNLFVYIHIYTTKHLHKKERCLRFYLFIACQNSHGLAGFYYSHNGFWADGYTWKGWKTKVECANECTKDCVAINTYGTYTARSSCFHYSNRADTVPSKKRISSWTKAYIRCLGRNERGHCSKIVALYIFG